jgi:hypothetical protein
MTRFWSFLQNKSLGLFLQNTAILFSQSEDKIIIRCKDKLTRHGNARWKKLLAPNSEKLNNESTKKICGDNEENRLKRKLVKKFKLWYDALEFKIFHYFIICFYFLQSSDRFIHTFFLSSSHSCGWKKLLILSHFVFNCPSFLLSSFEYCKNIINRKNVALIIAIVLRIYGVKIFYFFREMLGWLSLFR